MLNLRSDSSLAARPALLAAALVAVPNPSQSSRRPGRALPPSPGLLRLSLAAITCGARGPYAIGQWTREWTGGDPTCPVSPGFPRGRHPSVATRYRRCKAIGAAAVESAIADMLVRSGCPPSPRLAIAGTTLRTDSARRRVAIRSGRLTDAGPASSVPRHVLPVVARAGRQAMPSSAAFWGQHEILRAANAVAQSAECIRSPATLRIVVYTRDGAEGVGATDRWRTEFGNRTLIAEGEPHL